MEPKKNRGFSIIELMIVMLIIGIFAAVAIPHIMEERSRNYLTDLANTVEKSGAQIRTLAMQTRRATVVEFSDDGKMWMNILDGAECWSGIRKRCVHNVGDDSVADNEWIDLRAVEYAGAKIRMCNFKFSYLNATGTCQLSNLIGNGSPMGICYSGRGELWIRDSVDDEAKCSGTSDPSGFAAWKRACVQDHTTIGAAADASSGDTVSTGAVVRFNRFDDDTAQMCDPSGTAPNNVIDVTRGVYFPVGGAPFSKVDYWK